jgi:hypothetical protein
MVIFKDVSSAIIHLLVDQNLKEIKTNMDDSLLLTFIFVAYIQLFASDKNKNSILIIL